MHSLIFDIETGPLPIERLKEVAKPYDPMKVKGYELIGQPFDISTVKYGAAKAPEKRAAKEEAYRRKFLDEQAAAEKELAHGEEQYWREVAEKAALSPLTGQVLAIGYLRSDYPNEVVIDDRSESEQLQQFWQLYEKYVRDKGQLLGLNIAKFDVPFLVRRSWRCDVTVPEGVFVNGRYLASTFCDLAKTWGCGSPKDEFISLNQLGAYFGIGQKTEGICGGEFARYWLGNEEEHALARRYLATDLQLTLSIAERMLAV